jgi:hypothetical protein
MTNKELKIIENLIAEMKLDPNYSEERIAKIQAELDSDEDEE